jgi:hypothetical protein
VADCQVWNNLTDAPADEVGAERARVAPEGAGARLLALQASDGRWGGAAWKRGWDSTMHVLSLLREMGLEPPSVEARRRYSCPRRRAPATSGLPPTAHSYSSRASSTQIVVLNDDRVEPLAASQFQPPSGSCSASSRSTIPRTSWPK